MSTTCWKGASGWKLALRAGTVESLPSRTFGKSAWIISIRSISSMPSIISLYSLRLFESQGDWKGALRAGKELRLEVSTACWNSFNSLHFKSFHSKNPFQCETLISIRSISSMPSIISLYSLRLFESQGDWKGALRAGKELRLEVSTACWNSFNSLHFKSFHNNHNLHNFLSSQLHSLILFYA